MARMRREKIGSRSRIRITVKKKAAATYSDEPADLAVSHLLHFDKSARKPKAARLDIDIETVSGAAKAIRLDPGGQP